MEGLKAIYLEVLIGQVRALDQFGSWKDLSDEELLIEKYVKTKEDLKNMPVIADIDEMIIKDIRLLYQALALAFEKKTGVMCSVVMEMSHEGFGRAVVIADKVVIGGKYFKDAHRFGFRTLDKLYEEGEKMLSSALKIYDEMILKEAV